MASKNENLHKAKKAKNDEFYTRIEDIEKEVQHYFDQLKGKRVYCPCDDYRWSNFVKYFNENYEKIGLAGLVATNYDIGDGAWKYVYDGENVTIFQLEGDCDFRSEECTKIKDYEADVIITNPPFSLFREFVKQLMGYNKKFLIIGNTQAITYKEIFPHIKSNQLWLGVSSFNSGMYFQVPENYQYADTYKFDRERNGRKVMRVSSICWYTNIPHTKRNTPIDLYKKYNAAEYPKYDNYNAIEVSKVVEIPEDYNGVMGVPFSFIDKWCQAQFEILGVLNPKLKGKWKYKRLLIKRK